MLSAEELARSIHGAIRLAMLDKAGLSHFDDTQERFWRSFWAAALVLPFYMFFEIGSVGKEAPRSWGRFFVVVGLFYAIRWTLWPLIAVYITRELGRFERYYRYVMTYNWAQFVGVVFYLAVLLFASLLFPRGIAQILAYAAIGAVIVYEWFIARTALEIAGWQAALMVGLNIGLSLGLQYVSNGIATA